MAEYDRSYSCPMWWIEELGRVISIESWDHATLARRAREIDGRGKSWGPDRISKMRTGANVTLELVLAVSKAVGLPPPFFEATSMDEARAFERFRRRLDADLTADQNARNAAVAQALDAAVQDAKDQTQPVVSRDEGSPRDPRTRRAPRSG